ncbi:hypothetical protein BWK49_22535 [Mycobacterium intracellulare subsp. chimaera]|nr:hypothetical protein BWK49_22535 [Mycobacterium intracellulare subsp. chimaera]
MWWSRASSIPTLQRIRCRPNSGRGLRNGAAGKIASAASKASLHGTIRTIAIEDSSRGITPNSVLPGIIATPKAMTLLDEDQERICAALPSGGSAAPRRSPIWSLSSPVTALGISPLRTFLLTVAWD